MSRYQFQILGLFNDRKSKLNYRIERSRVLAPAVLVKPIKYMYNKIFFGFNFERQTIRI